MARIVIVFILVLLSLQSRYADDTDRYIREAEYYQKKADGYRRNAACFLKKAERYQREAAYYTIKGKTDRVNNCQRKAKRAMDNYTAQIRYSANAEVDDINKTPNINFSGKYQPVDKIPVVYKSVIDS